MKRLNILSILALLLAACMWSCYEDKGNYDYNWAPEVLLKAKEGGFSDTTIKRGQHLTIIPRLNLLQQQGNGDLDTVDFHPEDFSYQWVAFKKNVGDAKFELATTQNLDTTINLEIQSDAYTVMYYVTEKATGVVYSFSFKLTVATRYANAWLFLTEDDNKVVDLTIYGKEVGKSGDDAWVYEHGVLERSGFPYRGGGAKFIYYYSKLGYIYVGTGEATGWLGKTTLAWTDKQLVRYQMAMPEPVSFTFENVIPMGIYHFIASDGSIYPMGNSNLLLAPYNDLPPAVTGSPQYQKVKLAPFVGGQSLRALVYDETNEAMLIYKASAGNAAGYTAVALADNLKLRHRKIYFMQTYTAGKTAILAKDKSDNKYYNYIYDSYDSYKDADFIQTDEITNGELLEQAENFVCDFMNGFFYMSIGNKLYVLQRNELKEVKIIDENNKVTDGGFRGFDPICLLTRYTEIESTRPYIMVATYGDTEHSGKVYYLKPNAIEATQLTVETYYSGLDRVKGISRF